MKKFLVLMMVLGMASMANAALQYGLNISVNGDDDPVDSEYTLLPSEHLSLDVWNSVDILVNEGFNGLLVATMGASIPYTSGVVVATDSGMAVERGGNAHWYLGDSSAILPSNEEGLGFYAFAFQGVVTAGHTLFDEIDFHCDALGDVTIKLYSVDDDFAVLTLMDSVIIHQIPEPMTMALLGLGGLFIRRRK